MQNAAFPFVALISFSFIYFFFFGSSACEGGGKGPWEPVRVPWLRRGTARGGKAAGAPPAGPVWAFWGSGRASVSPTGGVEAVAPWSLPGDGAGTRQLVPPRVRTPGHAGSFRARREPAPAAGGAELIPSLSAPRSAAFFQDFCWESAPFPLVCPVPSRTSQRPLLGREEGGAVSQRGPRVPNSSRASPSSRPRFVPLPAAAGPGNGSGPPRRQ